VVNVVGSVGFSFIDFRKRNYARLKDFFQGRANNGFFLR